MKNTNHLPSGYNPSEVESTWYQKWEKAGLFKRKEGSPLENYTITIPPPNITGSLHMGHSLCYPIQDLLGRYWRLQGKNVWIVPGQDHAGISAQSIVEKQLKKEGLTGAKLGREKFVERVWEWRKESGNTILSQLRSLGCAFDWESSKFTLDESYVEAVLKVFVDWFDKGLIYRGKRVVNWDPVLETSISDIETERKITRQKLYHIRYPLADGTGEVIIATSRPETILADVAVAFNPKDSRYKGLEGKMLCLPLLGHEIPLLADPYPDPAFGTGAVKITPGHDPNDYEVGLRHNLPMPVVFDSKARISLKGPYYGLDRKDARKKIVEDLEKEGFLVKTEDYEVALLISERSREIVEPLLSEQWFVKQTELAKPVIEAVKKGKVKFYPKRYSSIFLSWMENIRDWCVSRQLWWGHRIPIYYTEDGKAFAALSKEEAQQKAGNKHIIRQEEDVLDTWFSSGLWPFAALGWPQNLEATQKYYPTSALITDRNIINLWVARMMMMGIDFIKEVPFHEVFIYATVLTADGQRMSKSLGTGVDPMEIIPKVGADALRFTLLSQTGTNQDIRFSEQKTEEARNFCNKIWNAARFVLMNIEEEIPEKPSALEKIDQWLLHKLTTTEEIVRKAYERYDIQLVSQTLYTFFWSELCDWYIEISKSRLQDPKAKKVPGWCLLTALDAFLKMIHPLMPHISEEIYAHLPLQNKSEFLMASNWPQLPEDFKNASIEKEVERWFSITRSLRALRAELGVTPKTMIPEAYFEGEIGDGLAVIMSQGWVGNLKIGKPNHQRFISTTVEGIDLHLCTQGLIDEEKELIRLAKEEEKIQKELSKVEAKLLNSQFLEKAKPEIVHREKNTADELKDKLHKIHTRKLLFSPEQESVN